MTKHETREYAFLLLYEAMVRTEELNTIEDLYASTEEMLELPIPEKVKQYVSGVMSQTEELDSIFKIRIRRNHIFYHFINIVDFSCDIIHMCANEAHTVFLGISHLISFDGFYNSILFGFEAPKKLRCDFFVVNGCTRLFKQIVDNG